MVSREKGGRPHLPSGRHGDTWASEPPHGGTFSISSRNSRRRVRLAVWPKPRLYCFMDRIVSALRADAEHNVRQLMQTFLSLHQHRSEMVEGLTDCFTLETCRVRLEFPLSACLNDRCATPKAHAHLDELIRVCIAQLAAPTRCIRIPAEPPLERGLEHWRE